MGLDLFGPLSCWASFGYWDLLRFGNSGPFYLFWAIDVMVGPYWAKRPINDFFDMDFRPINKERIFGPSWKDLGFGFPFDYVMF